MKQTLSREHRRILETTVAQARTSAEAGAVKALQALAVATKEAPAHATEPQKKLRVRLRAHGRALGDLLCPDDTAGRRSRMPGWSSQTRARAWIARCKDLDGLIDNDWIVCMPAVRGEPARQRKVYSCATRLVFRASMRLRTSPWLISAATWSYARRYGTCASFATS